MNYGFCDEVYSDSYSREEFLENYYGSGAEDFYYHCLCWVSEREGLSGTDQMAFVVTYRSCAMDFYDFFRSALDIMPDYPLSDWLESEVYSGVDNLVFYADEYCSTLLEVYKENSAQTTLPPSVTEEPPASAEPVTSPELSAVPEPSVFPGPSVLPEPAASAVPSVTAGAVTPGGAVADIPYEAGLLLRELQKTNILLSGVLFTLLFFWLVKKARTIVGGMTDDGKTG